MKFPYNLLGRKQVETTRKPKETIVDEKMFVCNDCNVVWEYIPFPEVRFRNDRVEYYKTGEIPTIGKTRKVCPKCVSTRASKIVKYQGA